MSNLLLNKWIKKNLFNSKKNLNSTKLKKTWFYNNNFKETYHLIMNQTSFLNSICSFSERLYCIYNNLSNYKKCHYLKCNNSVSFITFKNGYKKYCSIKCSSNCKETRNKCEQTCLKKYGVKNIYQSEEIKNKIKQTNKNKYGFENASQVPEFKNKIKKTCLKKYGVENVLQSEKIRNKIKQINKKKHGVENVFQSEEVKNKIKQTNKNKYGKEFYFQTEEFKNKFKSTMIKNYNVIHPMFSDKIKSKMQKKCLEKYGVDSFTKQLDLFYDKETIEILQNKKTLEYLHHNKRKKLIEIAQDLNIHKSTIAKYFKKHNIKVINHANYSMAEKEIINIIDNPNMLTNTREIITPYEIDIYIPDYKLAIEFDGLYWHANKDKNYHLMKSQLCDKKKINLFHIFENEWIDPIKKEIWKSLIHKKINQNILTINNNLICRKVSAIQAKGFMNNNHLKGYVKNCINLGIFYGKQLFSMMLIKRNKSNDYKILRYCDKNNTKINGSFNLMIDFFIKNNNFKSIFLITNRRFETNTSDLFEFHQFVDPEWDNLWDCGRIIYKGRF